MKTPITKEGKAELQAELERLTNEARPAAARAVGVARAHGDLSENAEYHAAKEKQGWIEARVRQLESALASCQVIDPAEVGADGRCIFGAHVKLRDEDGREINYRLVGEIEADLDRGLLSTASPTGRALLGKRAGDDVEVPAPGGVVEYELLEVHYSHPPTPSPEDNPSPEESGPKRKPKPKPGGAK